MSDTYNYEEGAIHNDHKKVLHVGSIGSNDIGKLIGAFFADDAEEAEVEEQVAPQPHNGNDGPNREEKQFQFIHYSISQEEGWAIHDEIKNLVARQKIQMICKCLKEMNDVKKVLLPPENPSAVYKELVRMGMPNGSGFSEVTFRKYYMTDK